jgi:2'-5' RNA ligase
VNRKSLIHKLCEALLFWFRVCTILIMENPIFQEFRQQSIDQLKNLKRADINIYDYKDSPPHYTIVGRPNKESIEIFRKLYSELQVIEPDQYYYPLDILHITFVGDLSIDTDTEQLINAGKNAAKGMNFEFDLFGIGSNKNSSGVTAYPINFSIHEFREKIRKEIGQHGNDYSGILKNFEYMAWVNYLRYTKTPSQEFLDKLYSLKDTHFGKIRVDKLEVFKFWSRVFEKDKVELMHSADLP